MEDECTFANCLRRTQKKTQKVRLDKKKVLKDTFHGKMLHLMLNDDAVTVAIDDCFGCRHYCYYYCCYVK